MRFFLGGEEYSITVFVRNLSESIVPVFGKLSQWLKCAKIQAYRRAYVQQSVQDMW